MHVKVYTKNDDPYSQMVKSLLQYYHVSFVNLEVSRDQELLREMIQISGQSNTPVLVIGEKVFCGFDRELIKEVLGVEKEEETKRRDAQEEQAQEDQTIDKNEEGENVQDSNFSQD